MLPNSIPFNSQSIIQMPLHHVVAVRLSKQQNVKVRLRVVNNLVERTVGRHAYVFILTCC